MLKPFDIEFQPFIDEINAKERAIQECGDFATMERVKGMILHMVLVQSAKPNSSLRHIGHSSSNTESS